MNAHYNNFFSSTLLGFSSSTTWPSWLKTLYKLIFCCVLLGLSSCLGQKATDDRKASKSMSEATESASVAVTSESIRAGQVKSAAGDIIKVVVAVSSQEQYQGLSGVRPSQFADNQGMLFFNLTDAPRTFWMPDTYFNLDIFFLDENLVVKAVERNVPHHPGRNNLDKVYRTGSYNCRHVFEMKASSPISQKIKQGSKLIWQSRPNLQEIEQGIRQGL